MADNQLKTFMVEDAEIVLRNFAGAEGQYNRAGDRNFGVLLDPETAEQMIEDGWNVKFFKVRDEGDEAQAWLPVAVNFKNKPPRVVLIATNSRTQLDEKSVEVLDWADIKTVDLFCNGSEWNVNGKSGVKAYLKTMFVTIREDPLEMKYGITGGGTKDDDDD